MEIKQCNFHIQGMYCRQCEDIIYEKLIFVRGISTVSASYWKGTVSVEYDPALITTGEICSALGNAGYPVRTNAVRDTVIDIVCAVFIAVFFFVFSHIHFPAVPKLEQGASSGMIFLLGMLTSPHCIIMCGGIMLSQTSGVSCSGNNKKRGFVSALAYNSGRILTCTLLGAVFGAVGRIFMYTAQIKSMVFTLAGAGIIIIGIRMWGILPWFRKLSFVTPSACSLPQKMRQKITGLPFVTGLLTGFMPCAALSAMWLYSMAAGSAGKGALSMLLWSAGTVPLMFIFGAAGSLVPQKYTNWLLKASVVIIIALGLKMFFNGIQLLHI